jgi:hypothetical protein
MLPLFALVHLFALGIIGHAMFTSPWPGPVLIGVASVPVLFVIRWHWRGLRGPQLHVEKTGVRIVAPDGDVLVCGTRCSSIHRVHWDPGRDAACSRSATGERVESGCTSLG